MGRNNTHLNANPVFTVDQFGNPTGATYQLASAQALAAQAGNPANPTANSTTANVSGIQGGSYLWDLQVSGTSPNITLQSLGSDGATWRDVASRTTSGTTGVVIGQGATVRLYNASANTATISSSLT